MRRLFAIAIAVAMALAGCSTSPITEQSGKQVPLDRIYQRDLVTPSSERTAKVTFLRDSGFPGSACSDTVLVNGKAAFAIRAGEYQSVHLAPGQYFFGLETGGGACPNVAISQNTVLTAGAQESYRILRPSDFTLRLTRIK